MHDKVRPTGVLKSLGIKKEKGKGHKCLPARDRNACRKYCCKEESRWEEGNIIGPQEFGDWLELHQGKRTDLEGAAECKTLDEVKEQYPTVYVKYNRGLEKLIGEGPDRKTMPRCIIMWGTGTGTGKSTAAQKYCDDNKLSVYHKSKGRWWDGYEGQKACIISDFDPVGWGSDFNAAWFKNFIDWVPLRVVLPVVVFITEVDAFH